MWDPCLMTFDEILEEPDQDRVATILREVVLETLEANASVQARKKGRLQAPWLDRIPAAMQKMDRQISRFHKERSLQNWECIRVA